MQKRVPGEGFITEEMYRAATNYYIQGETMESIARDLNLSRSSVSRLLTRAREIGLVRISVGTGSQTMLALSLGMTFGVRVHVWTAQARTDPGARFDGVARMAARLITDLVEDDQVIGVAWGLTMSKVAEHLGRRPLTGIKVVQLMGSGNARTSGVTYASDMLGRFGESFGAEVVLFPVPAFFDFVETREAMWRERSIQTVLALREHLDLAVFGVGSLGADIPSHVYAGDYLGDADYARLAAFGAVGDVCTVLLREDGTWDGIPGNERSTGPTPADLANVPRRICVVGDPSRAAATLGALRAGVVTDLVCDDLTAHAVAARAGLP